MAGGKISGRNGHRLRGPLRPGHCTQGVLYFTTSLYICRPVCSEFYQQSMTSDGASWSVVRGCTEYTFSQEQLAQKREKYARRRTFTYVKDMGWLGWRAGFRTCCSHPFCETMLRLKVRGTGLNERSPHVYVSAQGADKPFDSFFSFQPGTTVQAWRRRGKWLFGEEVRAMS